jgi:endonuclease G
MKKLLAILLVCLSTFAHAWTQRPPQDLETCKIHAPWGFPQTSGVQTICRQAYLVGYDASAKIPRYVTYELLPQNALGCVARTNAFAADQSITGGATPADYAGSGYDKGHQSPDGDLSWDTQVEFESFLMTNMAPQLPGLNRGPWKLLETSIRGWAVQKNQPYTIYVGAVYNAQDKKIGNGVVVPHAFYKIVINEQTNEVAGWWFPHVEKLGTDLPRLRLPISQIEQQAGVQFALPVEARELDTGKEWSVDFGALNKAKKDKCNK